MSPIPLMLIFTLLGLAIELVSKGFLAYAQVSEVFEKYKDQDVTPELLAKVRVELLEKARRTRPIDDPEIRRLLIEAGEDPDDWQ